jgi:transcriptional regulator with PAS, ATPase and Fis domain
MSVYIEVKTTSVMSTGTNAFWREVLDYIPGLVMLFRIDEQEQAHLIFVSDGVHDALGYEPEQYVLASEEQTIVKNDLEKLVDRVAALTQPDQAELEPHVVLTDRSGNQFPYRFDYRLFRPKSSKVNLISVALHPRDQDLDGVTMGSQQSERVEAETSVTVEKPFIAESAAMSMMMRQIDDLSKLRQPILLAGEPSTGKKTIAELLARKSAALKSGTQVWSLDLASLAPGTKRVFAGLDDTDGGETLLDDIEHDLQLVVGDIGRLKAIDQRDLLMAIETRTRRGYQTRIIATSVESLDELKRKNRLSTDFMYRLAFLTVFIPPLRDRTEDIPLLAEHFAKQIYAAMRQVEKPLDAGFIKGLHRSNWSGGMEELKRAVLGSLFRLTEDRKRNSEQRGVGQQAGGEIRFTEILPYEEMSSRYLEMVLEKTEGRIYGKGGAAELLGMKPTTLQSRLKKLGISK